MFLHTMFSSSLERTLVRETDLLLFALCLSPFLKMEDTLALVQASGRSPVFRDYRNNIAIARASSGAYSFRTLFGMLSGTDQDHQ